MTQRAYIAVEGPHDVAFAAELLRPMGLVRVQRFSLLDPYWRKLVPTTYPHRDDLLARVPIPLFLEGENCSVALHGANGITEIVNRIEETLVGLITGPRPAVGVILDADSTQTVASRFAELSPRLGALDLAVPATPGAVSDQDPRCGVFVLPDNATHGTLENLLLECGATNYPQLSTAATAYIDSVDTTRLTRADLREIQKPAGRSKAIVSSVASVLRPGKSIQVSIQDNEWLRGAALALPRVVAVRRFLVALLGLPASI